MMKLPIYFQIQNCSQGWKMIVLIIFLFISAPSYGHLRSDNERFSLYQPNYFIVGQNDLKMQFSFKYRILKQQPLYLGFSQIMFWNIYEESRPFKEINYLPEVFYRIVEKNSNDLKTGDMGYLHSSNGKKGVDSRSIDKIFVRAHYLTRFNRHHVDFNLMMYYIYNKENSNRDIVDHMGYWDFNITITDILKYGEQSLDFEFRLFAGSKVIDVNNGAYQMGLIYHFASFNMNPALYFQFYNGYSENMLDYNKRHEEYRAGLLLSF